MIYSALLHPRRSTQAGFSLVEMAVVLVILGLILSGMLIPLSTQRDIGYRKETASQLSEIRAALLGFAVLNGRLPCPATAASNGLADPDNSTTNCQQEHGFIPGRTLALNGSYNSNNQLTDSWSNPIRYSLSSVSTWAYADQISASLTGGNYQVCSQSACAGTSIIAENIVAVIHSRGKDGALGTTSPNQLENMDNDTDFVQTNLSEATNAEFDDIARWISPNILAVELLRAGRLE